MLTKFRLFVKAAQRREIAPGILSDSVVHSEDVDAPRVYDKMRELETKYPAPAYRIQSKRLDQF